MGGPATPGVGFAIGLERLVAQMKAANVRVPSKDEVHIFVAQLGDEAKKKCLKLIDELREKGVIIIRDMAKGQQRQVPMKDAVTEVIKLIGEDKLDTYSPREIAG